MSTDLSLDSKCYFEIVQVLYDILAAIADVEGLLNFAECIEYCLAVVDGTKCNALQVVCTSYIIYVSH